METVFVTVCVRPSLATVALSQPGRPARTFQGEGKEKGTGAYIGDYGWLWQDSGNATHRKSRARRNAVSCAESARCANGDFSRDSGDA